MTHFDFGVKGQGRNDLECQNGFRLLLIIPNNVSQRLGKGGHVCRSTFSWVFFL